MELSQNKILNSKINNRRIELIDQTILGKLWSASLVKLDVPDGKEKIF